MRLCSGQPRTEFALFTRLRSTCGTTHCERIFRFDFHRYTMHACAPTRWSIVTIARSYRRRIISVDKVDGQEISCNIHRWNWKLVPAPITSSSERIGRNLEEYKICCESKPRYSRPSLRAEGRSSCPDDNQPQTGTDNGKIDGRRRHQIHSEREVCSRASTCAGGCVAEPAADN